MLLAAPAGVAAQAEADAQPLPSIVAPPAGVPAPEAMERSSPLADVLESPFDRRDENRFENPIETDRDSFTPSVRTVGRRVTVIESAYSYIVNRRGYETHSFPEFLVRYGLFDRLELRLSTNYEAGGPSAGVSGSGTSDFPEGSALERESSISYGVKLALTRQDAWLPESSLIVIGTTPTSGSEPATNITATYVFGWEFFREWKLDAAIRYRSASERDDRFDLWAPSVVLKVPIGPRWDVHAEYFGIYSNNRLVDTSVSYFSPGVHYLVTPNFEIGARVGWGLNDQAAAFFTNVGVGMRF
jgi:hypothetical protein